MCTPIAHRVRGPRAAGSEQPLAAAAPLLGVTGQSESNIGRIFRGPGIVLMMFDAFVAAGAVASPSSSLAAGSDLGATSALSSSCADGRSRRRVTVIPESNAPSVPPLAWVLAIEKIPIAQAAVVAPSCYVVQSVLRVAA